ncbi:hypothetical protein C8F04DRAFT_1184005 [Mycena alexandri]|uniref:Uncharacterized protein n=1 Tax=Mycena alexandri TaxID=1745969 RepID=A0AAD6X1W2_9AGAR|nr:hypothetical protein C8F04DRAFT_1184005 [Mycena alexandri]
MLDDLRRQGTNVPPVPIPRSLVDAQTLQAAAVLTITIPPSKADLPTSRAAEKLDEVLKEDDTCFEVESDTDGDDDGDNNSSVATDASSDSDSDSESDEDDLPNAETGSEQRREFASQNVAALGEQAISRTIFEFRELESKFADLSEYLDQRVTGLSPEEREEIGRGYGQLANLMTKMDRVLNLPPPSTITPSTPSTAPTGSTSCTPDTSSGVREKLVQIIMVNESRTMERQHYGKIIRVKPAVIREASQKGSAYWIETRRESKWGRDCRDCRAFPKREVGELAQIPTHPHVPLWDPYLVQIRVSEILAPAALVSQLPESPRSARNSVLEAYIPIGPFGKWNLTPTEPDVKSKLAAFLDTQPITAINIAFSQNGFNVLNITNLLGIQSWSCPWRQHGKYILSKEQRVRGRKRGMNTSDNTMCGQLVIPPGSILVNTNLSLPAMPVLTSS